MATTPLDQVPDSLEAGTSLRVLRCLSDYPAGTWTLTYHFIGSAASLSKAATASGSDHLLALTAVETAALTAGLYQWQARATDGSEVLTVEEGQITIRANFATAGSSDQRTEARKTYDAIVAVLLGRASRVEEEYTVKGRQLRLTPIKDLIALRNFFGGIVKAEERALKVARGEKASPNIVLRLGSGG